MGQIDFQPLQKSGGIDFQPIEKAQNKIQEGRDISDTVLENVGNAATLGYLPHIEAKAQPITDRLANLLKGSSDQEAPWSQLTENGSDYIKARDANIARINAESQRNPNSALIGKGAGMIAGGIATPLPELAALGKVGGAIVKGAMLGGGMGAAQNPGDTQGQLSGAQIPERVKNAAVGTATGMATGALVNPATLNAVGGKVYDSGIKKILQRGSDYGKEDVGPLLRKLGIWGSADTIQGEVEAAKQPFWNQVQSLAEKADASGGKFSMKEAMQPAMDKIQEIRSKGLPNQQWIADKLEEQVNAHMKMGQGSPAVIKDIRGPLDEGGWPTRQQVEVSPAVPEKSISTPLALEAKRDLYNMTGDATWNEMKKTPSGSQVTNPLSSGLKQATENNVGRALGPEAQRAFENANANYGKLATVEPAASQAAKVEGNKNMFSSVDGMLLSHPHIALTKKLADLAKNSATRTGLGYGLTRLGSSPTFSNGVMKTLSQPTFNPWEQTNEEK